MAQRTFFRTGDVVTVWNRSLEGSRNKGRVICTNRKDKYGMGVVVLIDVGDREMCDTFKPDGSRFELGSMCHITLGWNPEEKE